GVRGAEIAAVSAEPAGLDDLAGHGTAGLDTRGLTPLPAFAGSHGHPLGASRHTPLVPGGQAPSNSALTRAGAAPAREAPAGPRKGMVSWRAWHESNRAESRLPARAELDAAAPDPPVFARRGGHLAVANLAALRAAGIGQDTPDPAGGKFGHLPDGSLSGVL